MSGLAVKTNWNHGSNVIPFAVVDKSKEEIQEVKEPHPLEGQSCEVYAFKSKEEIASVIAVLDKHIENACNDNQRQIAWRNKMLFIVGINVGIRASDLRELKYSFFFNEDGSHKDYYKIQPKKTKKYGKFVTMYFNDAVKNMIDKYVEEYPYNSLDDYLFASRKGENKPINVRSLREIVKVMAKEAGITQNIGSHSLRKTWARACFENAKDKTRALVVLQKALNHSDSLTTLRYVGLLDEEISEMYNTINLGIDLI